MPFANVVPAAVVQQQVVTQYQAAAPTIDYEAIAQQEADKRKAAESTFRDSYYSESEKTAYALAEVTAEVAALGYALPKSRAEFRKLTETARDKGWQQTYDKLLDIGTRFRDVVPEETVFDLDGFHKALADLPFEELRSLGAQAAEQLAAAAGGLDALVGAEKSYYDNYFTAEERAAITTQQLQQQFAAINVTMPKTREELKKLIEQARQRIDTEPGRVFYAQLLALNGAFASVTEAIQQVKQAADGFAGGYSGGLEMSQDAYKSWQDGLQEIQKAQEDAAEKARQEWQRVADAIGNSMQSLREKLLGQSDQALAAAQADFAIGTAAARAGDVKAAGDLPRLAKAVADLAEENSTSQLEQTLLTARTLASLTETLDGLQQFGATIADDANRITAPSQGVSGPNTYYAPAVQTPSIAAPASYSSAGSSGGTVDTAALLRELVAQRAELTALRRSIDDVEKNTARSARSLERAMPDDVSVRVKVVA